MAICLFIGGDQDGERIDVNAVLLSYRLPTKSRPPTDANVPPPSKAPAHQTYERRILRYSDVTHYVYVHGVDDPIQKLIEGYK